MGIHGDDPSKRRLDTQALSGLAHPLRVRLFQQLTHYGPATATQLGERLGESSGSTSYHLRQLERFGFVETDPERGNGRERWWRRVPGVVFIDTPDRDADPAGYEAATLVISELQHGRHERHNRWLATSHTWPKEWQDVCSDLSSHMALTAPEAKEFALELQAVIDRWKDLSESRARPADAKSVELQVAFFPLPAPES